ncbi:MAG: hypothetical protein CL912_00760 [Deltaproteobacteria bacterium]|nr:hypothetical protein [Deltaproteobacteria bacterium]
MKPRLWLKLHSTAPPQHSMWRLVFSLRRKEIENQKSLLVARSNPDQELNPTAPTGYSSSLP